MFKIGAVEYFSREYEFGTAMPLAGLGRQRPVERSMSVRLDALPIVGERFSYEYDFGSTTRLQLRVMGERTGRGVRSPVRLLARNTPPLWPCGT